MNYDQEESEAVRFAQNLFVWTVMGVAGVLFVVFMLSLFAGRALPQTTHGAKTIVGKTMIVGGCDENLWGHTYHAQRLQVIERCASVTGIIVDASHGKNKDGCRHEADADGHCFLKLDPGQERYINTMNIKNEDGMLVFEPECRYRVTQEDAKQACKNWKQNLKLAPIGAHVRITGAAVLDTQHGHREIHPVSSIEVLK